MQILQITWFFVMWGLLLLCIRQRICIQIFIWICATKSRSYLCYAYRLCITCVWKKVITQHCTHPSMFLTPWDFFFFLIKREVFKMQKTEIQRKFYRLLTAWNIVPIMWNSILYSMMCLAFNLEPFQKWRNDIVAAPLVEGTEMLGCKLVKVNSFWNKTK